jgi:hypothetical protein
MEKRSPPFKKRDLGDHGLGVVSFVLHHKEVKKVPHSLLRDARFFRFLLDIDRELGETATNSGYTTQARLPSQARSTLADRGTASHAPPLAAERAAAYTVTVSIVRVQIHTTIPVPR